MTTDTKGTFVNLILETAEELGYGSENYDSLMERGFRFINPEYTLDENREILTANL